MCGREWGGQESREFPEQFKKQSVICVAALIVQILSRILAKNLYQQEEKKNNRSGKVQTRRKEKLGEREKKSASWISLKINSRLVTARDSRRIFLLIVLDEFLMVKIYRTGDINNIWNISKIRVKFTKVIREENDCVMMWLAVFIRSVKPCPSRHQYQWWMGCSLSRLHSSICLHCHLENGHLVRWYDHWLSQENGRVWMKLPCLDSHRRQNLATFKMEN